MKLFFFLYYITIKIYLNDICEGMKTCYNCLVINNNCSWSNNSCSSNNSELYYNNNAHSLINSFLLHPFINSQYKCIQNENDIEIFKELNNKTIILSMPHNNIQNIDFKDKIKYHIYCFEYITITNIILSIKFDEKYKNNIIHLSLYDNLTNIEKIINVNITEYKINIRTNFFCIKITYIINNQTEELLSFQIEKNNGNIKNIIKKNDNIISYFILAGIILLIIMIISIFIICHKTKSETMKGMTIINKVNIYQRQNNETNESNQDNNCNKSNCSELQEKYFKLEQNSFVVHNYETLNSFVNNIHAIEKKNKYLKTIIKTLPSFFIDINNRDFIGSFCFFCENKIKINDNVCLLNCGHIFHYVCIYQQIITNEEYKCIICRENIII